MLQDFNICIQTQFVFGKNAQNQIGSELKKRGVKRVLIHHDNGEFLYATGLLESISRNLEKRGDILGRTRRCVAKSKTIPCV